MTGAAAQTIAGGVLLGVIVLTLAAAAVWDLHRAATWWAAQPRHTVTCVGCGEDPATVAHPDGGPGGLCPACSTRGHGL